MGDNCGIVTNDILRCIASEQTALSSVTSDQAWPVGHCPLPFRRMASSQDAPAALAFTLNKTSRLGLCCSLYVKCNFSPFPRHPFFDIGPRSHSLNTFLTPPRPPRSVNCLSFLPKASFLRIPLLQYLWRFIIIRNIFLFPAVYCAPIVEGHINFDSPSAWGSSQSSAHAICLKITQS